MKKIQRSKFFMLTALSAIVLLAACEKEESVINNTEINDSNILKSGNGAESYIVVLNEDFEAGNDLASAKGFDKRRDIMSTHLNRFLNGKGVGNDQVDHIYSSVYMGFSARLSKPQLERLQNDPRVNYIEKDEIITLGKPANPGGKDKTPPAQQRPYGIDRVGGGGQDFTGSQVAWVIDSGIDYDHPDLNVDQNLSKTFVSKTTNADDDNGHGTHCAGIIAAINNSEGVIGVAPGATVAAVKVLNRRGSGTWSGVIAGIDYVTAYVTANNRNGDVANLSLGGGAKSSVDNAVIALAQAGVKVAVAAGNESTDANNSSPARANHTNIYTVSAMDRYDNWAYFSNYGNPPVDYCAPGYSVYSCYKGGSYATLSGTSMAAPHVAGILLYGSISSDGAVNNDPAAPADLIAHR